MNSDSAEKLQELLETIASGINKTEEILARSLEVEAEVSQHREAILAAVQEIGGEQAISALQEKLETSVTATSPIEARVQTLEEQVKSWSDTVESSVAEFHKATKLVSKLTLHTERKAHEIQGLTADVQVLADMVGSTVGELGGIDAFETLQQKHQELLTTLEQVKIASEKIQALQTDAQAIQERLQTLASVNGSPQRVELSKADIELITNQVMQEHEAIDSEHRQKIRALELKQQSLISLIFGGVGATLVLLVIILIVILTKF